MPHARPTDRAIGQGEPVVIDIGATIRGYTSDITRTICLGNGDSMFHKVYDIVLGAQLTAMATLQAGMTGEQADRLARTVIEQAGYKDAFGHGLGHGVGLATHEEPRLGTSSADILAEGMVFTIEPGIYISGWGGVRIEDMVVLEEGKVRPLTKARKTWRP
jgi:Xaa-Pro aminopeptidase